MEPLTPEVFILTSVIAAVALLVFLHLVSAAAGHDVTLQKLRIDVVEARNRFIRQARGDAGADADVIIVDEASEDAES